MAYCHRFLDPAVLLILPPLTAFAVFGVTMLVGVDGQGLMFMFPERRSDDTQTPQLSGSAEMTSQLTTSSLGTQSLLPAGLLTVGAPLGGTALQADCGETGCTSRGVMFPGSQSSGHVGLLCR